MSPTENDDDIYGGFLTNSLNGLGGVDRLTLDYSGLGPNGQTATSVNLNFASDGSGNYNGSVILLLILVVKYYQVRVG